MLPRSAQDDCVEKHRLSRDRIIRCLLWLCLALYVGRISYQVVTLHGQWDLQGYYDAATRYAAGLNPYEREVPGQASPAHTDFVYPPATLGLFKGLLVFDYPTLFYVYYGVKLVALGALLLLWVRIAKPDTAFFLLLTLLCLLAYQRPIGIDCRTGNISVFEQCCVWGGVWCFLRGRTPLFCLLILCSAFFKLVTLPLVFLLIANGDRKSLFWAMGSVAAFLAFQALSYTLQPALFHGFLVGAGSLDERGAANPASMALIRDLVESLHVAPATSRGLATTFYALFALLVLSLAAWAAVRSRVWRDKLAWVMLVVLTYALLLPRLKDYSYILLLLPTAYVLRTALSSWLSRLAIVAVVSGTFFAYQPFVGACVVWGIFIYSLIRAQSPVGVRTSDPLPGIGHESEARMQLRLGRSFPLCHQQFT